MAVDYVRVKNFQEFLGIDLKSSDIERERPYASGGKNARLTDRNDIKKRYGYQYKLPSIGGNGLFTYNRVNATTGAEEPELIAVSDKIYRVTDGVITITYTGPFTDAEFNLYLDDDTDQFRATFSANGIFLLNQSLGKGYDEATIVTVDDLVTAINAISAVTCTYTGDGTIPAAFINITRQLLCTPSVPQTVGFCSYEEVNTTATNPLAGSIANRGSADYENPSAVNLNNVLYISNGYDALLKYDGQTLYKAGMPTSEVAAVAAIGAATGLTGSYYWGYTYVQIDDVGNVTESNLAPTSNTIALANQKGDVTIANIQAGSGFNTNCAIVNGVQAGVNIITVDDGSAGPHTMKVGDTAYFFDGVSSSFITRNITAITATSITVDGAPVNVADNAVISNNLRIAIYRVKAGGSLLYFVDEIPNNSFAATQVFVDAVPDVDIIDPYIIPEYAHDLPPKGKYLTVFRNLLIVAGDLENVNRVHFSSPDGAEYFPAASHAFDVKTGIGDKVTAVGANNDQLAIFKNQSIFSASGDLGNLNFRVDQLTSGDLGCEAHATVKEVREGVLYFLTARGPYQIVGAQLPRPVGERVNATGQTFSRIEPYFTDLYFDEELRPRLKRAVAINFPRQTQYLLYVPTEDAGAASDANNASSVWVFDYSRGLWMPKWDNIQAAGGLAVIGDELYWSERVYSDYDADSRSKMAKQQNTGDQYDYADHANPIEFQYIHGWEHMGEPSIFKKPLRCNVFVLGTIENATWELGVTTEINFIDGLTSTVTTINFGESGSEGYGIGEWGVFPWGEAVQENQKFKLKADKCKAWRYIFSNSQLHTNVLITGWETEVAAPYRNFKE